ncbi:unnamed protein product [Mytilus edulis]|uniref:Uncharacterized protein n=1 Tax=Mytilus edulis TaxID=6550 RepID=A0A8S3RWX1_MYTED|nr:unnamed protein product [Mytilus edulis]
MLYCGRQVMITHNQVGKSTTDGFCGPNNWANCPACRVILRVKDNQKQSIEIPKLKKCLGKGKWQGLSGLFYCGKKDRKLNTDLKHLKSDGICGPDTGVPCNCCGEELFNGYSIESCDNIFKPRHRRNKENVFNEGFEMLTVMALKYEILFYSNILQVEFVSFVSLYRTTA